MRAVEKQFGELFFSEQVRCGYCCKATVAEQCRLRCNLPCWATDAVRQYPPTHLLAKNNSPNCFLNAHTLTGSSPIYLTDKNKRSNHKGYSFYLVRMMGLEPIRHATHAPQTCLSAYSSTSAYLLFDSKRNCSTTNRRCQYLFSLFFNSFKINVEKSVAALVYLTEIM